MKRIIAILLVATIVVSCNKGGSTDKKAELEKLRKEQSELAAKIKTLEQEIQKEGGNGEGKARFVTLDTLKKAPFTHYLEIQGRVEAEENVNLTARSMGIVTKVNVNPGDVVTKGQVLAVIDDAIITKSVDELKSRLDFANIVYMKQKNLWDQKIGTEVQFLQAKNNKEALEKNLATLNEQLDLTRIKSPINGTVDEVNIRVGEAPNPQKAAIRVVNSQKLKAKAEVAESYLSHINTGDEVKVVFPDMKKEISTKITFAGKAINPVSRTFDVEVKLGSSADYRQNMLAVMNIVDYKAKDVITIPMNVVQNDQSGQFVYIAENVNGKLTVKKKQVELGMIYKGTAEVKSGLENGEMLITIGYQDLNEGDVVKL